MTPRFYIYLSILFAILLYGGFKFLKLSITGKLIVLLIAFTFFSELVSRYFAIQLHNSSPPYHILVFIQFLVYYSIFFYYLKALDRSFYYKIGVFVFFLFCYFNVLYFQDILMFPSNTLIFSSSVLVLLSLLSFKQMLQYVDEKSLFSKSYFWFVMAALVFFSITFLFWSSYNFLIENKISTKPVATVVYYVNIVYYLLLLVGLYFDRKGDVN